MTNETLSDKILIFGKDVIELIEDGDLDEHTRVIPLEDVKEFIKELSPELFHNIYEEEANKIGWETNRKCRVKFDELPETNQETMIMTLWRIKKMIFGEELLK